MERIGRTIAFPGAYVWALGAALLLVGAGTPAWWAYLRTHAYAAAELSVMTVGDGPVRPPMVLLPVMPDGKRFAISERPVTFGEFIRVVGEITIEARCGSRRLTREDSERSVVCMSTLHEAAHYANLLTDEENQARRVSDQSWLTPCYKAGDINHVDLSCTGYRLPTVEEWSYAATLSSVAANTGTPRTRPTPVAEPENNECRSAAWFIFGMCDTSELAIAAEGPAAMKVDGSDVVASPYDREHPATFRIVRTALRTDLF
jgi:hypothetical protein